jgi:cell division protein FtsI (penicillin-binding protein 3)
MTRPPLTRLAVLLVVLCLGLTGIVVRLGFLQVRDANAYDSLAFAQRLRTVTIPAGRGAILDRDGRALAMSLESRDVYADPTAVQNPRNDRRIARTVASILGLRAADVYEDLTSDGAFVYLARQVDRVVAERLEKRHLPGIGFLASSRRYYPNGVIAPQVLGFVGVDGQGLAGLELQHDATLAGRGGQRTFEIDPSGRLIPQGVNQAVLPAPGHDLVTTIDRQIQFHVQGALRTAVHRNKAKGGTVIVMNPRNGDILAMATYPWFMPHRFAQAPQELLRNEAIVDVYEPGSVNKVVTASAALEEGVIDPKETIEVEDHIWIKPHVLHDAHPHPPERMMIADIIGESSNVGTIRLALRLGADTFAGYLDRFRLGHSTEVGFPGEAPGILPPVEEWYHSTLATTAIGHGVAVTPLQMISVYAAVANDGLWVQPRLVRGTIDDGGAFHPAPATDRHRAVSKRTADKVTNLLAWAVRSGTGTRAQIPGYWVAGKTGTANIPKEHGRGYQKKYVASFIGFAPASDPSLVVAVMIDRPETEYGALAAAPLFKQITRHALARLRIAPAPRPPIPPHVEG